jgi:hypothetical protein
MKLTEAQMDAAIDAYDKTWCATDRGRMNKEMAIEAAINAALAAQASVPQDGDEWAPYEAWLRKERGRRCDFDSNAGSWSRAAWQAALASNKAAAVAVDESTYPSDPYIDTMAVNACVAGDGKGRLIFTIQAARKFALDVLRARDDGAFEAAAVAVGDPAGWKLVPIDPTDDMEAAAEDDYEHTGATFPNWKSAYRAMLCAVPSESSPGEEYQVKSDPIMCWTTYQGRAVAQKHFDQLKADGCSAQFRVIYTAPIASEATFRAEIGRIANDYEPDGASQAILALEEMRQALREALATHPAAAQPSRAEVLEEAAKLRDLAFENVAPGHGGSYEEGCRDAFDLAGSQIRALKDKP